MAAHVGTFFCTASGDIDFTDGVVGGSGFAIVARRNDAGVIKVGVVADFFRTRGGAADANDLLPGTKSMGGLVWVAPYFQIKSIVDKETDEEI